MKKTKPLVQPEEPTTGVVHIRVNPEIRIGLASIAAESGKSSNDLAVGALAEFIEVVKLAKELEAGLRSGKSSASDFLDLLGVFWVHRLSAMGLAGSGMKAAWRMHLAEQQSLIAETAAHRAETSEHRKGK